MMTTDRQFQAKTSDKVLLVEARLFSAPGKILGAFSSLEGAQDYALSCANMLREHVGLPPGRDRSRWAKAAETARRKHAYNLMLPHVSYLDDEPDMDGWVNIMELPLDPAPLGA